MCRLANYRYSVDAEPEKIMEKTVELNRLKPSQRYTFNLRHVVYGIISKPFWTKEGSKFIFRKKIYINNTMAIKNYSSNEK